MNLDELRSAQAKERRKDSLQHLRDSFYDDVASYVADLRAARDRRAEQVAKPFSDDDVRRLSDEVETAEEVAEALYERRVGKVVKLASFAAADMSVDADGMTTEERRLFDDLVDRIKRNKSSVLDVLSGEVPVGGADAPASDANAEPAANGAGDDAREPTTVGADSGEDSVSPAPEPDPADGVASRAAGGEGPDGTDEVADALTGAMGGANDDVADALGAAPDEAANGTGSASTSESAGSERAAGERAGSETRASETAEGTADGATTDGGPTAVPPEPAPPGAPGVDDAETETETGIDDRATVRITRDVGAIFGVDEREYDLEREDVVTLPVENAAPLVQRDAAERLD